MDIIIITTRISNNSLNLNNSNRNINITMEDEETFTMAELVDLMMVKVVVAEPFLGVVEEVSEAAVEEI